MPNKVMTGVAAQVVRSKAGTYGLVNTSNYITTTPAFRTAYEVAGNFVLLVVWIQGSTIKPVSVASAISPTNGLPNVSWQAITAVLTDATTIGASMMMFGGFINNPGTDVVTVTYTGGTPTNQPMSYDLYEWTANYGLDSLWLVDATVSNVAAASTTLSFPGLTIAFDTKEIFFGQIFPFGTATVGSTPGFTYNKNSGFGAVACYKTDYVAANGSPTATQSPSGIYMRQGVTIAAIDTILGNDSTIEIDFTPSVPTGMQWVIYKISFEVQTTLGPRDDITATVLLNGRTVNTASVPGAISGPPFFVFRSGDNLVVRIDNAVIGTECVADLLYQEYPNGPTPLIAGVV